MSLRKFRMPAGAALAAAVILTVTPAQAQEDADLPGSDQGSSQSSEQGSGEGSNEGSADGSVPGSLPDSSLPGSSTPGGPTTNEGLYEGSVEVVDGESDNQEVISGQVFDDANKNSVLDGEETGVEGVSVSNGVDVVTTDAEGRYELPARDNMSVSVSQPSGWQTPVDENNFAQFSYEHYPEGSPDLKFGGLEPTGNVPTAVNFPLAKSEATADTEQSCPIAADTQTYDKEEVEYARKGGPADLIERDDYAGCGVLLLGDNVGDDLSLNPDLRDLYTNVNGPVRALPGNHDMDYDAVDDVNATDTYRAAFGSPYYSYNVGDTHFVALDNIEYNGQKEDGSNGDYLEKISDEQLEWLKNDLATVDNDQEIMIAAHSPIVNYKEVITDNANELYDILADYPNAFTVGGHTHTLENLIAGEQRSEWAEYAESPIDTLSHDQIVAGAVSGDWYSGELNDNGVPHAYTSDAAEPGIMTFNFGANGRSNYYTVRNEDQDHQFLTGVNSPAWREWAADAQEWQDNDKAGEAPEEINPLEVSREDLAGGESYLTTSFFGGSTEATVDVELDGNSESAELTQPAEGEALNQGWEYTETISATHNLSSTGNVEQASPHVWRLALPEDLEAGEHTANITGTDRYGQTTTQSVTFTVTE
ncbi:MAG TPA: calcineurin-like phosphoesterase C-terminal domain-containing protein [Candidatus Corynebacterium avicola]|uniref:Calcineurin-like phosphoesterase C-terminal domain-containing protein n=1 Tax=Candidatus Corynebacterium avicola TaxID=2838527 RepID=A0A9D1UKZ3_9CORY|nr:calcineurin-like phosphoesterase C-terminal domain-containing protein [Candidatus Corynebacterium avicola]